MTPIQKLPVEVLRLIFSHFQREDLLQCQQVCKTWYSPALVKLLQKVDLHNASVIEQFMSSIDQNSDPLYLEAVKAIRVNIGGMKGRYHNLMKVENWFFCFHNLQEAVFLDGVELLRSLNNEVCQAFLKSCPKLKSFHVYVERKPADYFNLLYNVQPLLTVLDMQSSLYDASKTGFTLIEYITSFPRLQKIHGYRGRELNTIANHLPIIEKLPDFDTVELQATLNTIGPASEDGRLAEDYLKAKTTAERDILLTRFARIKHLVAENQFCQISSIEFASKYLTGLRIFRTDAYHTDWEGPQQQMFLKATLDMVYRVDESHINFTGMPLSVLSTIWGDTIMQKRFRRSTSNGKVTNTLSIRMTDKVYNDDDDVNVGVDITTLNSCIEVKIDQEVHLNKLGAWLSKVKPPFKNIDVFALRIGYNPRYHKIDIFTWKIIFDNLASLKKVVLDTPIEYEEISVSKYIDLVTVPDNLSVYPNVKMLVLRLALGGKFLSLLQYFSRIFPNLKDLDFLVLKVYGTNIRTNFLYH